MNKPSIRTKGYSDKAGKFHAFIDNWDKRKLSELATMHARIGWQNLRTSEFLDDGDYLLITGTDFEDGRINFSTCHYVEKERYEQDKHIQISDGSILITKDGTLGKVAYVQGLAKPATLNAGVFNVEIKDKKEVDGKYLFQYLKAPFLMDYVNQRATGGTIKHLNQSILVDFPVMLPERKEQEKIGLLFEEVDNIITIHQRELLKLNNLKIGFLQKLFPQGDSKVPEIRFDGYTDKYGKHHRFTEDWEQLELGRIADKVTKKNTELQYSETFTNSAEYGIINQMEFFDKEISNSDNINGYYVVEPDDFVYNPRISSRAPVGPINRNKLNRTGVVSPLYTVFKTHDIDTLYLEWFFKSNTWHNFMRFNGDTGARSDRFSIKNDQFFTMPIAVPRKEEQEKIGAFLEQLDSTITLYQHELEILKRLKTGFLQKMFV